MVFKLLKNLITRAVTSNAADDSGKIQKQQIQSFGIAQTAQVVYPYGYNASAPVGSDCIGFNVLGDSGNKIIIPQHSSSRPTGLEESEVSIGNPVAKSITKFSKDGSITSTSMANVTVSCKQYSSTIESSFSIKSASVQFDSQSVKIGKAAVKAAARVGDQIKVNIGGVDYIGEIISGSAKTLIE